MTPEEKLAQRFTDLLELVGDSNQHLIIEFLTKDFKLTLPDGTVKTAQEWIDDLDEDAFDFTALHIGEVTAQPGPETGTAVARLELTGEAYGEQVTWDLTAHATFLWTFSDWFIKELTLITR